MADTSGAEEHGRNGNKKVTRYPSKECVEEKKKEVKVIEDNAFKLGAVSREETHTSRRYRKEALEESVEAA